MPTQLAPKLLSWASDIDEGTIQQAQRTARLPIIAGHVALMPDAHFGMGATVGSVIPTWNAIIPSAVGVDIGCGMIAVQTNLVDSDLPDNLEALIPDLESAIPAGVGKGHSEPSKRAYDWFSGHHSRFSDYLNAKAVNKLLEQFGTLGSGNHFFEICLDEAKEVWIVLHSGSRGIGNLLAQQHIKKAKQLAKDWHIPLEDPNLAYFVDSVPEFQLYIGDMLACQDYALANRETMMDNALRIFFLWVGKGDELKRINCHHNFTQKENHGRKNLWITRKGAIKASEGDLGIIPGSMGTRSYIVSGLGNPASYESCAHGAGRRYSRSKAKELFTVEDLAQQMEGKVWQQDKAKGLLDEIPSSYKDVEQVMEDQKDLVKIEHTLSQILNFKGQ